ncbi:MAG: hypothetical protein Q8J97_12090 [Flavobacteriaceae bacterium]|nr:hypothetical protein [Flavobacteriaceae bacterium]
MKRKFLEKLIQWKVKTGWMPLIEVKKGKRTKSTSLNVVMKQYKSSYGIRISGKNFGFKNHIKSVPLYAVWRLMSE